ncbi:hypothetical protein HO173_010169 [Letharia columbiana]|uniref:Uncharacterized protein n=1 Tax=Letharia columbiana TaxID=112416 RepID=A0A8H6FN83_9LECA|nr:uncharacterized protein HO173_010169 [Letharia columbiana]KAF6231637.1 hypothetical protein HO173_010169 [Letharia columbiana]
MAFPSISNLPLWFKTLCLLSIARQSECSPVSIVGYNSLVNVIDTASMVNTNVTSSADKSATFTFSSTKLGAPIPNCATLPDYAEWFQPSEKFDSGDCPKALELFFTDYTLDHDGTKYEFLASGVTPVHGIATQRVPLKVAFGTCYVVIAMRNMFVEGELPGETPSKSAGSDISSFAELYQNALEIYAECSQPEVNQPGWYPAGDLNSIGVFIWQAASEINKRVKLPPPTSSDLTPTSGYGSIGDLFGDTA